jgi:hypothetical protein
VAPSLALDKLRAVPARGLAVRFAFGAVISLVVGLVANTIGVRFAGMFLAFPAILPASLTLIQDDEGRRDADRNAIGAILGGFGLIVFAGVGEAAWGRVDSLVVLILLACGWLAASLGLYALLAFVRPDTCDRWRD